MSPDQGGQPYQYGEPQPPQRRYHLGGPQPPVQPGPGQYQPPPFQPPQQWHQPPPPMQQSAPPMQQPAPPEQLPPQQGMPPTAQPVQPPEEAAQPSQPLLRPVTIEEIVQTDVVTAERDTPIRTVVAEMAEKDVGSVVIVEGDAPVGILTDRTVALALETNPDVASQQAGELISGSLVTGSTEMSVFEAIRRLEEEQIRRLPIVDEEGTLAGIVTLDDILVLLGAELENVTSIIKAQSTRL